MYGLHTVRAENAGGRSLRTTSCGVVGSSRRSGRVQRAELTTIVGLRVGNTFVGGGKKVVAVPLFVIKAVDDAWT